MSTEMGKKEEGTHVAESNLEEKPDCLDVVFGERREHGEQQHNELKGVEHVIDVREKIEASTQGWVWRRRSD